MSKILPNSFREEREDKNEQPKSSSAVAGLHLYYLFAFIKLLFTQFLRGVNKCCKVPKVNIVPFYPRTPHSPGKYFQLRTTRDDGGTPGGEGKQTQEHSSLVKPALELCFMTTGEISHSFKLRLNPQEISTAGPIITTRDSSMKHDAYAIYQIYDKLGSLRGKMLCKCTQQHN